MPGRARHKREHKKGKAGWHTPRPGPGSCDATAAERGARWCESLEQMAGDAANNDGKRVMALTVLVAQNSLLALTMRYSRTLEGDK